MTASILIFWILASLMTVIAVLIAVLPWIRPHHCASINSAHLNVAVYRDRLNELETALDYPSLTFEQREQERQKLAQELLEDVGNTPQYAPEIAPVIDKTGRWALFAIITTLPLLALLLYFFLGNGAYFFAPHNTQEAIDQVIIKLVNRLENNPNDARGWIMLGRSYMVLDRYSEALAAYTSAYALEGEKNFELAVDYAEVMVLANENHITEPARTLLTKVLHEHPDHPKGLWLIGLWAFQEEHYTAAIEAWQRLKSLLPEGSEFIDQINGAIGEAKNKISAGS